MTRPLTEAQEGLLRSSIKPKRRRMPNQEQLDSMLAPHAKQVQVDLKAQFLARGRQPG